MNRSKPFSELTEEDWQGRLTQEEFDICRKQGTEAPFSGKLLHNKSTGKYACTCCQTILFESENKYDSGCGWPSFDAPINKDVLRYLKDSSYGMERIEIRCRTCDCHLGHVFNDGPKTTGERFCVNSVSLSFNDDVIAE